MSDDLVKRLRTPMNGVTIQQVFRERSEAADRIEELEAENKLLKTSGIIEVAAHNNRVTEYMFHWEGRALDAEAKLSESEALLAKAVEALGGVMIGGNHLAIILPDNFPPAETEPLTALEAIGYGYDFEVWCCWRAIMLARTTLAELKGENDE